MSIIGSGDLAYNNLSIPMAYNDHFLNIIIENNTPVKVGELIGKFYNCDDPATGTKPLVSYNTTAGTYTTYGLDIYTPSRNYPGTGYLCFAEFSMGSAYKQSAYNLVKDNLNTHFYTLSAVNQGTYNETIAYRGYNPSIYCHDNGMVHFLSAKCCIADTDYSRVGNYTAVFGNNRVTGYTNAQSAIINFLSGDNPHTWFSSQKLAVYFTANNGFNNQTYCLTSLNTSPQSADVNYWKAEFYTAP